MIIVAAREHFAAHGYAGTSVRAVAASAGVDPALVYHYFRTKDELFLQAMDIPLDPREALAPVIAAGVERAGERILETMFAVWDNEQLRLPLLAVVRRFTEPEGQPIRDGFLRGMVGPVGVGLGLDEPERRMTLVASQVVGLVLLRYVLEVEPLASAPADELVATYAPTIQRYLSDPLPRARD
jgi:AcrR family transcriptional regulator